MCYFFEVLMQDTKKYDSECIAVSLTLCDPYEVHIYSSHMNYVALKLLTLFESDNERQKIEPVPIPLPRASKNFPDVKTRNGNSFHNWTSEIIPFIRFGMQMDGN